MITLNKETIEYVKVTIGDRGATPITDLSSHSPQFRILSQDELEVIVDWTIIDEVSLMTVYCLVDTTPVEFVLFTNYKLYCQFDADPEFPVLGPIPLRIV